MIKSGYERNTATPNQSAACAIEPRRGDARESATAGRRIHRVCIGCNNMFEVTMENYEAKHCSACHKG